MSQDTPAAPSAPPALNPAGADEIRFGADGLVPAVVQDRSTGEVLMVGFMNREALAKTLETGDAWFWSRSRRELWHKGATSGNYLRVRELRRNCEDTSLLLLADPEGPTCHTGARSCYYRTLDGQPLRVDEVGSAAPRPVQVAGDGSPQPPPPGARAPSGSAERGAGGAAPGDRDSPFPPQGGAGGAAPGNNDSPSPPVGERGSGGEGNLSWLFEILSRPVRREGSYTAALLAAGVDRIGRKIGEEAAEVIIAAKNRSPEELAAETADLWYHSLVLLLDAGLTPEDVYRVLRRRHRQKATSTGTEQET